MKNKLLTILAVAVMSGCASTPKLLLDDGQTSLMQADKVFTQTNLHPDPVRHRLYSLNYQQAGLIPRCSEVELTAVNGKKLVFNKDGVTYHYFFHKASGSFDDNIKKYFSDSCDNSNLPKLNAKDKKGIKEGKVFKGMSKEGVVQAIGYPPVHVTPSLEANTWQYWKNRFNTFKVLFNSKGLVEKVVD
jgi:hypothetical protein